MVDLDLLLKKVRCLRLELPEAVAKDVLPEIESVMKELKTHRESSINTLLCDKGSYEMDKRLGDA